MGVEALTGNAESLDQFIASVRPHPGCLTTSRQLDSSKNIRNFLRGSKLATSQGTSIFESGMMRQDRYAL
ncbi:hypothetical protein GJ744_008032 [Endocarpon pusillum]|uniref:Uncharacterized protein n=1 Tax=Endocarpon pusillum TaxID=364733 RepID=A0A8H7E3S5_9EURO|nr:hypothetical protein GJ744_008032 [Endocarpon pusillum]